MKNVKNKASGHVFFWGLQNMCRHLWHTHKIFLFKIVLEVTALKHHICFNFRLVILMWMWFDFRASSSSGNMIVFFQFLFASVEGLIFCSKFGKTKRVIPLQYVIDLLHTPWPSCTLKWKCYYVFRCFYVLSSEFLLMTCYEWPAFVNFVFYYRFWVSWSLLPQV